MLLADFYLCELPEMPLSYLWDGISLVAWVAIFILPSEVAHYTMPFLCLPAYMGAFKGRLMPKLFRIEWITIIGGMCYSLYLTHPLVLSIYEAIFRHLHGAILSNRAILVTSIYLCTVPTVLVVGTGYFVLIERPCMRKDWPQRLAAWMKQKRVRV
jgi:peptidoglycan/LPS O-acetylase OafA/YrhL